MIQVFKLMNGGYDDSLPELLTKCTNNLRGHNHKLFVNRGDKDIRKYSFNIRVISLWNSLPSDLVNAKDVKTFEIGLDKHWQNQDLMFMDHKAKILINKRFY